MSGTKERIVNLLKEKINLCNQSDCVNCLTCKFEDIADCFINNGGILPPYKVGDTVWVIFQFYKFTKPVIESRKILSVQFYKNGNIQYHYKDGCFYRNYIGVTVFLTKEEAKKALQRKEGKKEND